MENIEIMKLIEEFDFSEDDIILNESILSDTDILEYLEKSSLYEELPQFIIDECAYRYGSQTILNESIIINEGAISSAIGKLASGLLAAGGIFTSALAGPYGYLVSVYGVNYARQLFRKMKVAAANRDSKKMNDIINQANAEVAAAKKV